MCKNIARSIKAIAALIKDVISLLSYQAYENSVSESLMVEYLGSTTPDELSFFALSFPRYRAVDKSV